MMHPQSEQDIFAGQVKEISELLDDVLSELPDDTPVSAILAAFGSAIDRVFSVIIVPEQKRTAFDWLIANLKSNIGDRIPPKFNGG